MTNLYDIWQHNYSGDFASGVLLLTTHNPGAVTKQILTRLRMLAAGADYIGEYERGKLAYALHSTTLPVDLDAPQPIREKISANPPNPPQEVRVTPTTPDEKLTSDLAIALHKEHSHVHALLVDAKTDEERARYARDIMDRIIPALDAEYDRLRSADAGQVFPPLEGLGEGTGPILNAGDARAFRDLQSVRSRISTLRKKILTEKDPKRKLELEQQLETKLAEKERLETELA